MAETPLPARGGSQPSFSRREGAAPAQQNGVLTKPTPGTDVGPMLEAHRPAPKSRPRASLAWPFLGGALVFGCAYFAYAMLSSPERVAPKTKPTPTSSAPSKARPPPAADAGAPPTSSAAVAPPPPEGMVYIAPAAFRMGEGAEARPASISRGFFLDRDEVTVRAYAECVSKRLCTSANRVALGPLIVPDDEPGDEDRTAPSDPPQRGGPLQPNEFIDTWTRACNEPRKALDHPVNCVDFNSAAAYCRFRGRRLPTEAEWELAARGPSSRPFVWGDAAPDCARACIDRNATCRPAGENVLTCPTHKHASDRTPEGAFDLAGNVSEWVADGFAPKLPGGTDPAGDSGAPLRVVRGGNFVDGPDRARSAWRLGLSPNTALATVGFRCAMDATAPAEPPKR
jgi:serine/threonine-protein kinase